MAGYKPAIPESNEWLLGYAAWPVAASGHGGLSSWE